MHLHAPQVLAAISGLLALSSANPLSFDAALGKLDKRGCQADCGLPNRPLARQLGQPCGGQCDQTYRLGSETCSCDLGAIISNGSLWLIALAQANAASITSPGLRPMGELATPRDGKSAVTVRVEGSVDQSRR
ncbi:MAG: hypothetical protein L6R36_008574 [Xanthoria steineri]|nr:MAG: hypothetical protein L6R36_008574 [Xanthoria steineri]